VPRRKGIFRRIADRIIHPVRGRRKPQPPAPPPAPPVTPPEQPPELIAAARHELRMEQIYADITGSLTGYLDWRELYDPLSVVAEVNRRDGSVDWVASYPDIEEIWDDYLRAYYLTTHEPGHITRDVFAARTGIPNSAMDWDLWREMRRGTT
jgi:hypothetical protein